MTRRSCHCILSPVVCVIAAITASTLDASDATSMGELLVVGQSPRRSQVAGIGADGSAYFKTAGGQTEEISLNEIVRWNVPSTPRIGDQLLLADGSRLILAASWGASPPFELQGDKVRARTKSFGIVELQRSQVRAACWQAPRDVVSSQQAIDKLLAPARRVNVDALTLDNGDVLTGRLTSIAQHDSDKQQPIVTFDSNVGELKVPLARVRAFCLPSAGDADSVIKAKRRLMAGFRDGSLLAAQSISAENERIVVRSLSAGALSAPLNEITLLQSFGDRVSYLSEMQPIEYVDQPYLDLHWLYRDDRNVKGQVLRVRDQTYVNGLGMHSAARIVYRLDGSFDRFAAEVAVDDAAEAAGSVVFRILLHRNGQWHEGYISPVVRGGDSPIPVAVELSNADQLSLAVEYADHGDERDYADWLDARLERTSKHSMP
jgi:hypothetical protein